MCHVRKILRLLSSGRIKLELHRLVPGLWGLYDFSDRTISIRKSLCEKSKIRTLVHECLHAINPTRHENWVRARENEVVASLTASEYKTLARIVRKIKPHKEFE